MRRLLVLAAAVVVAAAVAGTAGATSECNGLKACVRVAGPWVVVPPGLATTQWKLLCPKRFVVGGLDAELTTPALDVAFLASLGSPVNPGISTSQGADFIGRLVAGRDPAATFRPHIGCIPTPGGKQRVPTARRRVFPPSPASVLRATVFPVGVRETRATRTCHRGERLLTSSDATGFYTVSQPSAGLVGSVHVSRRTAGGRVTITIRAGERVRAVHAVVQLDLLCAGVG